jgi:hypothetical protein
MGGQSGNYQMPPQQPPGGYGQMHDPTRGTGNMQSLETPRASPPPMRSPSTPPGMYAQDSQQAWNSQPQMPQVQHKLIEGAARPIGDYARPRAGSNRSWIILAVLMLAGLGAGILIAVHGS